MRSVHHGCNRVTGERCWWNRGCVTIFLMAEADFVEGHGLIRWSMISRCFDQAQSSTLPDMDDALSLDGNTYPRISEARNNLEAVSTNNITRNASGAGDSGPT